jgi:hypothetical protein
MCDPDRHGLPAQGACGRCGGCDTLQEARPAQGHAGPASIVEDTTGAVTWGKGCPPSRGARWWAVHSPCQAARRNEQRGAPWQTSASGYSMRMAFWLPKAERELGEAIR